MYFCCCVTRHLELRALSNDLFIALVDCVDQELEKTPKGQMILASQCLEPQLERLRDG